MHVFNTLEKQKESSLSFKGGGGVKGFRCTQLIQLGGGGGGVEWPGEPSMSKNFKECSGS
jgi:hypothetical protein